MPLVLLSAALAYLIRQPGMVDMLSAWTHRPTPPEGEYHSIQDGKCWKMLPGPDGQPFFMRGCNELRIAVILHVDWYVSNIKDTYLLSSCTCRFSASSSSFSASYSTGAISFSIPNLPPAIR